MREQHTTPAALPWELTAMIRGLVHTQEAALSVAMEQITAEIRAHTDQVRAHALEEAAAAITQHNRKGREWVPGSFWDTLSNEAAARIRALAPRSTHA